MTIPIYTVNKFRSKKKSYNNIFDRSKIKKEFICSGCQKKRYKSSIEIDHIFPHILGGKTSIENSQFLCKPCHSKKTGIDRIIFNCFKKLGCAEDVGFGMIYFYLPIEEIKKSYFKYFKLIKKTKTRRIV